MDESDETRLAPRLITEVPQVPGGEMPEGIALGDCRLWCPRLKPQTVDLLILDPPYNMHKTFGATSFAKTSLDEYAAWLGRFFELFRPLLKKTSSIYICSEWETSAAVLEVARRYFKVRNRITWEREKGRGAKTNWKNASEDIWFCTVSNDYFFDVDAVKLRRRVIAPYVGADGQPKDWENGENAKFRDTHPSNLWTDISVPFWSMRENTDHPTQKSEKLIAKLILASSRPGDFVLDPFAGSGTTCVVAKKLGRRFLGIEIERQYALYALKRLEATADDPTIQGLVDGVFWERNSADLQRTFKQPPR